MLLLAEVHGAKGQFLLRVAPRGADHSCYAGSGRIDVGAV